MTKIAWDKTGNRLYETGVDQGVLYLRNSSGLYPLGVPWNGLSSVTESPSGAEANPIYADNIKYLNLRSAEEFGATVEAYTYPDEFAQCDGSAELAPGVSIGQQNRKVFGLSYRTILGNDVDDNDHGYKLHIVYGAQASPSEKGYSSVNDSPEAVTMSWELTTTPVKVTGFKPTASVVIDSTKVSAAALAALENILYGSANADPRLPLPDEIATIFASTPSAIAMSSIVPADDATDIAVDSAIVLTFNNKIQNEMITVASEEGNMVTCAKAWDTAGKVLTLTPTANLSNGMVYIVMINGVSDVYGQSLAAAVKNFMTVAG